MEDPDFFTYEYLPWRGITVATMRKFNIRTRINARGEPEAVGFEYSGGEAIKVRPLAEKKFFWTGEASRATLFGKEVFAAGQQTITLYEGEIDAASGYQILNMPSVSVRSASAAMGDCQKEYEYLNSFAKIYIAFDNDEAGKAAAAKVASLFDNRKVFLVKMSKFKDANEHLTNNASEEFKNAWYNAKRFIPDNILSSYSEIREALSEKSRDAIAEYPFAELQRMTYGIRPGELVLIKAPEGVGKTEIMRAIEYHVLGTTDENIGIIHLEERKSRSIQGLAGYYLGQPVHLPDSTASLEEVFDAYQKLTKRDERVHIYKHFGSDDTDVILSSIRFLVAVCGCKLIFLDHISILVSGSKLSDERQELDYLSTQFKMLAEELDFAMIFISHINDSGDTRGSRNISKVSDVVVAVDRDKLAPTEVERNTTYLTIEKNRPASMTGPAGMLYFNRETFLIEDVPYKDKSIPKK